MYQRKFGETPVSSPVADRNSGGSPSPTKRSSNARGNHHQRMALIRNHATKNHAILTKPQLVILSLVLLIGVWGFLGASWMLVEIDSAAYPHQLNDHRQGPILSYLRERKTHTHDKDHELLGDRGSLSPFRLVSEEAPECHALESPDDITVTLVTQVSHDRLWMMKHHCDRYRNKEGGARDQHPMSIAVYANATREEILDELRGMDCGVDPRQDNPAPVDVSVLDGRNHGAWNNFPVNELRNLALSRVRTTHILYIDVDFWPNDDLYEVLMGTSDSEEPSDSRRYLFEDPKLALVIPAFQLWRRCKEYEDCREKNLPHMEAARTYMGLAQEVTEERSISVFDPKNMGGHGSTDYKSWFHQEPGSLLDIECLQSKRYEPYVLVRYCKDLPPFQTAFGGYGKNKITWMMQIIASGYVFSQVGGAYLIHYPHLDSASRMAWIAGPGNGTLKRDTKRAKIDRLYLDFRNWLQQTIPSEKQRLQVCKDHQDDDSKLWVESSDTGDSGSRKAER